MPGDQSHIHVKYKGNEVWNQNADGTPHHPNKIKGPCPKSVKEKIKEKTEWDPDNPPGKQEKQEGGNNNNPQQTQQITLGVGVGLTLYILWKAAEFLVFPPLVLSPI